MTAPVLLVAAGLIAGYVYARAVQSVARRAEVLSRPIPNPRAILADCDTCGRTIQDRHGRCSSCGSSSIWTLGVAVPEPSDVQVSALRHGDGWGLRHGDGWLDEQGRFVRADGGAK